MTSAAPLAPHLIWSPQITQPLEQGRYDAVATFYEQAIDKEPDVKSHYWYLGLVRLLQQQEAEAQTTWLLAMAEGDPAQVEQWSKDLLAILQSEAERQAEKSNPLMAWAIRQHMREIAPQDLSNLLHIIQLSIENKTFVSDDLTESGSLELLQSQQHPVDLEQLVSVIQAILDYALPDPIIVSFLEACWPYCQHLPQPLLVIEILLEAAVNLGYAKNHPALAAKLTELGLRFVPDNPELSRHLPVFYQDSGRYLEAIEIAKRCCAVVETLPEKVFANHLLIKSLMSATGRWEEPSLAFQQHLVWLKSVVEIWPQGLPAATTLRLLTSIFFLPYFQDKPAENRLLQNQIAQICHENIQRYSKDLVTQYCRGSFSANIDRADRKVLKIGYISHCLKKHSVGWITRWLFQHHDRDRFQIHAYLLNQSPVSDFAQQWFANYADRIYGFEFAGSDVLEKIYQDEIDILVDLDSVTLDVMADVLSVKPAPIQLTWLGWDASGLPTIDYFVADPYVLPHSAQSYYAETIWRLPQTFVAVDGFEVGIPTLRRDQLSIPNDAIVYLMSQKGYKHNLNNVRQQMQILKAVPGSYLLIKGLTNQETRGNFFEQVATEEGVTCDRLRFLPFVAHETIHRANLGIADVVLDTYPYNGATTTLETLWMGIPLVTQVGQQFSSRNSYSMMMNVGVTEGIAWTDDEYIEWGVRLGQDANLRQQIHWRLLQSRQTAPLWNARQFTAETIETPQRLLNLSPV